MFSSDDCCRFFQQQARRVGNRTLSSSSGSTDSSPPFIDVDGNVRFYLKFLWEGFFNPDRGVLNVTDGKFLFLGEVTEILVTELNLITK